MTLAVVLMFGSLFTQAQICNDDGEKRVTASKDENDEIHCWSEEWTTQCWVPCGAEEPETIAP